MKSENIILQKSFAFAVNAVKFCRSMQMDQKEYVLSKQLLRSATSIGANVEEANDCNIKKDFQSKISIANKEARKTLYWIRVLAAAGIVGNHSETESLLKDAQELVRILSAIQLTTRENLERSDN